MARQFCRLAAVVVDRRRAVNGVVAARSFALNVGRQRVVLHAVALGPAYNGHARAGLLGAGGDVDAGAFELIDGSVFVVRRCATALHRPRKYLDDSEHIVP